MCSIISIVLTEIPVHFSSRRNSYNNYSCYATSIAFQPSSSAIAATAMTTSLYTSHQPLQRSLAPPPPPPPPPTHSIQTSVTNINHNQQPMSTSGVLHRKFTHKDWDINDTNVPHISNGDFNDFFEWVDGHQRLVYPPTNEDARKHTSGWAMRNTNNHNVNILKKSCLGVLVCSTDCVLQNGGSIHLRPAICDKARKKQQGKLCPNRYAFLRFPTAISTNSLL